MRAIDAWCNVSHYNSDPGKCYNLSSNKIRVKQWAEWFYCVSKRSSQSCQVTYILSFLQLFPHSRAHSYPNLQFLQLSSSFFLRNASFPQATILATVVQISISRGDVRVFSADKKVFKSDMTFSPQLLNAIIRLLFIRGRSQHKMAGLTGSSISQVLTHGMHRVTLILILQPICVHFSWNPKRKALGAEVRKFEQRFEETFLQLHISAWANAVRIPGKLLSTLQW